jgi:hypothetical protein
MCKAPDIKGKAGRICCPGLKMIGESCLDFHLQGSGGFQDLTLDLCSAGPWLWLLGFINQGECG